jgi:hypothetical protein
LAKEKGAWGGASRNHGELLKLGFEISEQIMPRHLAQVSTREMQGSAGLLFLRTLGM